jgi:hypothetical protein
MMRGTIYQGTAPIESVTSYKHAAMVSSSQDDFRAAYDGLAAVIAEHSGRTDNQFALPVLLCDSGDKAQKVWKLGRPYEVVMKRNFGTIPRLDLVYGRDLPGASECFVGVIEDDSLYGKRRDLWGKQVFRIAVSKTIVPRQWRTVVASRGADAWGNAVTLE